MACVSCGKPMAQDSRATHCQGCVKALRTDAEPRWLKAPPVPPVLRATAMRAGRDSETLDIFSGEKVIKHRKGRKRK